MGVSLRSSSNDEGSSRVWIALLEQHNPSSPVFHNLRRFIDAISPTAPTMYIYIYNFSLAHCQKFLKEMEIPFYLKHHIFLRFREVRKPFRETGEYAEIWEGWQA